MRRVETCFTVVFVVGLVGTFCDSDEFARDDLVKLFSKNNFCGLVTLITSGMRVNVFFFIMITRFPIEGSPRGLV